MSDELKPWLVCATEGCHFFGGRQFYGRFCVECGSELTTTLPRCCAEEVSTDKGFCAYCGTPKARVGEPAP